MMAAVTPQTKLAAVTHVSNVTGRLDPIEAIIRLVHEQGGVVLVDAAQSAPHMPIDVQEFNKDIFLAFSGHKLMAPMGIGVLYGKRKALLEDMPPFLSGGEMIDSVSRFDAVYAPLPHKFEAGTVNGGGAVALQAAIEYMQGIGWREINKQEELLTETAMGEMSVSQVSRSGIGSTDPKKHHGIISFTIDDVHPHDIASILMVTLLEPDIIAPSRCCSI
ncbi:MAG: aminotransferase class V-fold PLP-dependent enzyme [Lachnospiraceae bacterium]